jgi:hypothetical protein
MGALIGTFVRVFAGVGLGELMDKLLPDRNPVPVPYKDEPNRWTKLLIYAAVIAAGTIAFQFIAKKLKLKF